MNGMRKLLCLLMAMSIAAFALPGIAAQPPQKVFSLTMAVVQVDTTQAATVMTATVMNLSPPSVASSNISSFSLSLSPVGGLSIFGVKQPASGTAVVTSPTSITVTGMSPLKGQQKFTLTFYVSDCGDGSTWSAEAWTGSRLTGSTFILAQNRSSLATNVACGALACGQGLIVNPSADAGDPSQVTGSRGLYNKDGTSNDNGCNLVDYFVTNTIPSDSTLHLRWDRSQLLPPSTGDGQSSAAFLYTVNGLFDSVAWLTDGSGNPVFILAPLCPDATLPLPYGTLTDDKGGKILKVDTSIPVGHLLVPEVPFAIMIELERILVTKVSGSTWTVERGQLGTDAVKHPVGALAMSTPLPPLAGSFDADQTAAGYAAGKPAQMCIQAQTGSTTTFIDIGDGWIKFR